MKTTVFAQGFHFYEEHMHLQYILFPNKT